VAPGGTIGFLPPGEAGTVDGRESPRGGLRRLFQHLRFGEFEAFGFARGKFVTVGRLDGNYSPSSQSTDIGSLSAGPNPVAGETLTTRDEFLRGRCGGKV